VSETVCTGCGGVIDYTGIDPFTVCECSDCGAELIIPLELDFLKLEKHIRRQKCFEVYQGFDSSNNINSMIFVLDPQCNDYNECLQLAKREAEVLTTLKHANICPLINYGEVAGHFFICEPFMDGYSLSSYAPDSQGVLDVEKVVDVVQASALGLAVSHHKEIPHHDLCAENVHIDARGNVRIKNFFISRFVAAYEHLKEDKSSVSPYYISPEKAECVLEDKRGDIFSFGVLFFYMLTGKFPFVGRNDMETVYSRVCKKEKSTEQVFSTTEHRILTPETVEYVPPVSPASIRPDIPAPISNIILRMLEYHPYKRPTMPEILDVISLYKAQEQQARELVAAQRDMVTTKTRAIPKMGNLSGRLNKENEKRKKFFF